MRQFVPGWRGSQDADKHAGDCRASSDASVVFKVVGHPYLLPNQIFSMLNGFTSVAGVAEVDVRLSPFRRTAVYLAELAVRQQALHEVRVGFAFR
jgi:hypothetical protein